MQLIDVPIEIQSKKDRVEFFWFGDCHIGSLNCAEKPIRSQVKEIIKHSKKPNTHVVVIFGGDICDYVKPGDIKRYDINCLADWFLDGEPVNVRERLADVCNQQLKRAAMIFKPLKDAGVQMIGAIEGNHEFSIMHYSNCNIHHGFCNAMGIPDLSDECMARVKFSYHTKTGGKAKTRTIKIYTQHGHGGGRTAGAEPNHLQRLRDEWEDADIVARGHSHTALKLPPKPVLFLPNGGPLPKELRQRYRYAFNWGCWVYSHSRGPSTYASRASYPARAMTTTKAVVWPFWNTRRGGDNIEQPKIELRDYSLV